MDDNQQKLGSKIGGAFTITLVILLVLYLQYLYNRMHLGIDDNTKTNKRANRLINGENVIFINETNFLPHLELINRYSNPDVEKVLGDLTELQKYIEVALITENRNIKHDFSGECDKQCVERGQELYIK
jgi:hypothetical protein